MFLVYTFVGLCILGMWDAGYLIYKHRKKEVLVCPLSFDCNAVTESKWGKILGIRNEVLGFIFYILIMTALAAFVFFPSAAFSSTIFQLLLLMLCGGALYSFFLILIQIFAIKNYCLYCLLSALINFLLLVNGIALFFFYFE